MNFTAILIFIISLTSLKFGYGYIYCDPFSQAKMLKCVCSLLDYSDIHMPSMVISTNNLLCDRYQTYKQCTKGISPVCKTAVAGNLDTFYHTLCVNHGFNKPCKFMFTVNLEYCPIEPLCEGTDCYVNHGSKAVLNPEACIPHVTSEENPLGGPLTASGEVTFTCRDGELTAKGFEEGDQHGVTAVSCPDAPPPPPPPPPAGADFVSNNFLRDAPWNSQNHWEYGFSQNKRFPLPQFSGPLP